MADFYKTSELWVIDYLYEGRPRRWCRAAVGANAHVASEMAALLRDLYGNRAKLIDARRASEDEERQYLRGQEPKYAYCPTGRFPLTDREAGKP